MATPQVKHYSLLDYIIVITTVSGQGLTVTLGGSQSYLGRVTVQREKANITKTTDVTGSTVYSFSNDHSGTVSLELSFVSTALDSLLKLIREKYLEQPTAWKDATFNIDITRSGSSSAPVVSLMGCMLSKYPDWEVSAEVGTRTYEFLVAQIEERTFDEISSRVVGTKSRITG